MTGAIEEDPIVLYTVIRDDLGMSVGKMCAQSQHGMQYMYELFMKMNLFSEEACLFAKWNETLHRKVTLKASEKEMRALKSELALEDIEYVVVVDEGLTEIPAGSETCITIFPMYRSNRTKTLKRLQALK
jgi:PTH2 family peptidyl-tRNA hydrolase